MPPPEPFQPTSEVRLSLASRASVVPPTATTLGDMAGYPPGAPLSPEEAMNLTAPWPAGVVKWEWKPVSKEPSPPPQLIDTATTPGALRAWSTPAIRSLKELENAS